MQCNVSPPDNVHTAELLSVMQQLCLPLYYLGSSATVFHCFSVCIAHASAMSGELSLCCMMVSCFARQGCSWLKWQMLRRHSSVSNGTC